MKRTITRMAAILLAAVLVFPTYVNGISAEHAILVDAQTGRILFEKNADQRTLIASTTKIMTALIVCEQCNVLDRVKICKESVGIEGSSMYLQEGQILKPKQWPREPQGAPPAQGPCCALSTSSAWPPCPY